MLNTLKDIMAVLGGVVGLVGVVVGIVFAVRRATTSRRRQQRDDDKALSGKFAAIQETLGRLEIKTDELSQFRQKTEREAKELLQAIEGLRGQCSQQRVNVTELDKDLKRVSERLERAQRDLADHREQVSQRYLTLASYQNDLIMMTGHFDAMRQNIRDLTLMLTKARRES